MLTIIISYVAGLITVLAPCILPLLPVILGGSFSGEKIDKKRPLIITGSLVLSLITFTVLLKATTVLIDVDPVVFSYISGSLVILLGVFMLVPNLWARLISKIGFESKSQSFLSKSFKKENSTLSAILIGIALGPVFSSCSPTYAWVIAVVVPENASLGMLYLIAYCLGVASSLLAIALLGQRLLQKVGWASNPKGIFQRAIAVLFIAVGLFVITGTDKKVQTWLVERDYLNLIQLEQDLVPKD